MDNKMQLACLLLLCGSDLVKSSDAVKPNNRPSGGCRDESVNCPGSYMLEFKCPENQRFCVDLPHIRSTGECEDLPVITRDSWGAKTPLEPLRTLRSNLSFFIIHHAAGYSCSNKNTCLQKMKEIQKLHQTPTRNSGKGFFDIGYHYLIGGDGTVFEGRGGKAEGAHSPGYNQRSIGVCLLGNFMTASPTTEAITSLQQLHTCLQASGVLSVNNSVFGHKDVRKTECPGTKLYKALENNIFGHFWHSIKPEMWTSE